MKTLGIVAHSAEGGALCFQEACREGARLLGEHFHPRIVLSAVPMGLSLSGWRNDRHDEVAPYLAEGVRMVAAAGADFYICPDNTAHLVLDRIADALPLPGLHIAHVVCAEIERHGWERIGLLGTRWTMTGRVYEEALKERGLVRLIPDASSRERLNDAIFDELCQGIFSEVTTRLFLDAIGELKRRGAQSVILGCTEIPIIVTPENSSLPVLDSTRLLARAAVRAAVEEPASDARAIDARAPEEGASGVRTPDEGALGKGALGEPASAERERAVDARRGWLPVPPARLRVAGSSRPAATAAGLQELQYTAQDPS